MGLNTQGRARSHVPGPVRPSEGRLDQYEGSDGSIVATQDSTPPPTCTASENPAFFTIARHSADRTPDLQCSTSRLSCGRRSSAAPDRNSPLGMSTEPGIETISYSSGSCRRRGTRDPCGP